MRPKLRLSRLRDIGWSLWDPIGLLEAGADWAGKPFANEYDRYLAHAAGQLRRGAPEHEVAEYLCEIEAEHMGLGRSFGIEARVRKVVQALKNDETLWSESSGSGG